MKNKLQSMMIMRQPSIKQDFMVDECAVGR